MSITFSETSFSGQDGISRAEATLAPSYHSYSYLMGGGRPGAAVSGLAFLKYWPQDPFTL